MRRLIGLLCGLYSGLCISSPAAILYVDLSSPGPFAPYTNWATAAANIQDAVDAAKNGDIILVNDGIYSEGGRKAIGNLTNRVAVDKPLTVRSVSGPDATVIVGQKVAGTILGDAAIRCVYLTSNCVLDGFTLVNGATSTLTIGPVGAPQWPSADAKGGGVLSLYSTALVTNCLLTGNAALAGGGVSGATLKNCVISENVAFGLPNDSPDLVPSFGGGANGSILISCLLTGNSSSGYGGGACGGKLFDCLAVSNTAAFGGGGAATDLYNCTIVANTASNFGGGIAHQVESGYAFGSFFTNIYPVHAFNCIVVSNTAPTNADFAMDTNSIMGSSCTMPLPTNGTDNITNDPRFMDSANGNFHLQSTSPCINAGNNLYAPPGADLDANPRISGGTVDMGAYEFQNPASSISYAWLQQFGLPTDGSADNLDSDHDGLNNFQEWRAGTDPTNAASVLQLLTAVPSGTNLVVSWQSVANINYYLQRTSGLTPSVFQTIATNIPGQSGSTSYLDTNAPPPGPWFYRVGVQ